MDGLLNGVEHWVTYPTLCAAATVTLTGQRVCGSTGCNSNTHRGDSAWQYWL